MAPSIFPIAAGYLLGSAVSTEKAQAVLGCVATKTATAGLWGVDLTGIPYDPTKHIVTAMVTGVSTSDNVQVEVSASGTGFQIQAFRGAGAVVAANESMHFTVHKLSADK